ncbi:MAG: putative S-adenosylmethionine uptake transporter [Ramlibacter sp.]|nr:putative S-adenosylmethionine uptake transporter [Ramlibacter sp.]
MRELLAVVLMASAMACFAAMDTTTKFLAAGVPALMVIWARNVFQLAVVSATLLPRRGRALLRTRRPGLQLGRAVLLLGTSLTGIVGIRAMPLAEFTAILLLTPIALTLLAALGQRERVPTGRWLCVAGGLVGALLVLRPGVLASATIALLAVAIVAVNTCYQWVTGRLAQLEDAGTTQFYTGAIGTLLASLGLPLVWQALPGGDWALLALMGMLGMSGHLLLLQAYGRASVSQLTPYLYLQLAFATVAGWIVFSHRPDDWGLAGMALIGASGVLAAVVQRQGFPVRADRSINKTRQ